MIRKTDKKKDRARKRRLSPVLQLGCVSALRREVEVGQETGECDVCASIAAAGFKLDLDLDPGLARAWWAS